MLEGYEKFMNDYIEVLKKYKEDPNDAALMGEYTTLMSEASQWASKTGDCSTDPAFAAKFSAIQMKIATAASGM
jgi:hypothetical protein